MDKKQIIANKLTELFWLFYKNGKSFDSLNKEQLLRVTDGYRDSHFINKITEPKDLPHVSISYCNFLCRLKEFFYGHHQNKVSALKPYFEFSIDPTLESYIYTDASGNVRQPCFA